MVNLLWGYISVLFSFHFCFVLYSDTIDFDMNTVISYDISRHCLHLNRGQNLFQGFDVFGYTLSFIIAV